MTWRDDEAELDEREWPDDADTDADDLTDTVPCPFCKKPVYESADICPHCRNFISFEESLGTPLWVRVVVGLLLVAFLWGAVLLGRSALGI